MKKRTSYLLMAGQTPFVWIAVMVIVLLLSAFSLQGGQYQDGVASGAQVWIEFPLNNINLPNQDITFVVYATDASGVSGIELKINGTSLPAGQLTTLSSDGSNVLVRLDQNWLPPAEGEYTLDASASGASASVNFCIGTCDAPAVEDTGPTATHTNTLDADEPTPTPTPTPTASLTPTLTPTPTLTLTPTQTATAYSSPTPTPYTESSADFWAAPPNINAGECTTLNWNVYGDFQAVYFEGISVNASGSDSECPTESYTYHLQVIEMDGSATDHWATVEVYQPPPADTTGPTINYVTHFWEGCTIFGEAGLSDPSGVIWAEFWFNHNEAGWAWIQMNNTSGDQWVSQVGIETDGFAGSLVYKVRTEDSFNNESWSGEYIHNYSYCGE